MEKMPIQFKCSACGKPLFAQDSFAGQMASCPACQAKNRIPLLAPEKARLPNDPCLIDMERASDPDQSAPAEQPQHPAEPTTVPAVAGESPSSLQIADCGLPIKQPHSEAGPEIRNPQSPISNQESDADGDPTKRCPMCAQIIKAAAKKCRFCGSLLDEELKAEEERKRQAEAAALNLSRAELSTNLWRTISSITTRLTGAWLIYLTLQALDADVIPWPLVVFNVLLAVGLFWTSRQMRAGPAHVFLSTATAIIVSMPLNFGLGLPIPIKEITEELIKKNPQANKDLAPEDVQTMLLFLFTGISFLFSMPAWIAALKVAAVQRLKRPGPS